MAMNTFWSVAALSTFNPYILNPNADSLDAEGASKGSFLTSYSHKTELTITIGSVALAVLAFTGFTLSMAIPAMNIPLVTIGSGACLMMSITLLAVSAFWYSRNPLEQGEKRVPLQLAPEVQSFTLKSVDKDNKLALKEEVKQIRYYLETASHRPAIIAENHRIARIAAVSIFSIALVGMAIGGLAAHMSYIPLLPWIPLIALGTTAVAALGIAMYVFSVYSLHTYQLIPLDAEEFTHANFGVKEANAISGLGNTTLKDQDPPKRNVVYLSLVDYQAYLDVKAQIKQFPLK